MGRIGDNARQPRDIQNAFFQIEIPGALLLRQQTPLEPIGEFGNNALQMGKLLVKLLAQPRQFIRIAKIIGGHHFIELRAEGVVARGIIHLRHFAALLRATWLVIAISCGAIFFGFFRFFVRSFALHLLRLGAEHFIFLIGLALPFAGLVLLGSAFAAFFAFFVLLFALSFHLGLCEVECGQQLPSSAGEGALVFGSGRHFRERLFGIITNRVAPQIQHAMRGFWCCFPSQAFTRNQAQGCR